MAEAAQPASEPINGGLHSRREFVVGGALGAAAIFAALARPRFERTDAVGPALSQLLPDRIGTWTSTPYETLLIPQGEDVDETYDDVATRYFTSAAAAPVILLIAYGGAQSGKAQLHRPEVCYPAAGFSLRDWPDRLLNLNRTPVATRSLTAFAPGRTEQILYWTRIGQDFPTSSLEQRWSILRQSLGGNVPDGILVRISSIDRDRERALRTLGSFAQAMVGSGSPDLRRLLTGNA